MSKTMLEIRDLFVSYGAIDAINGINLQVAEGSIVAILGANGAGKSTLLRTISGVVKANSGSILLDGKHELLGMYPYKIAELGMIQSPEGRLILQGLTTEENLMVGTYSIKSRKGKSKSQIVAENLERVFNLFPILKERRRQQANTLSGGEQQMLAIGRALMAAPKVLLLDEPSLGLAPLIIRDIFAIIQQLKEAGNTILIVEQNAFQTLKIADYAYVLELGRVSIQGPASELIHDETLVEAYLGGQKT
ncbi:MAG: ABC transporter ATP-binding protein [Eubacteriales bacterium]|nr:ABC transporter ATP-binding protein [Eubacteriales bacterium]MDD4133976.1 ABC transporter ATP-binding protein [Eubacteriales bacterium]